MTQKKSITAQLIYVWSAAWYEVRQREKVWSNWAISVHGLAESLSLILYGEQLD